MIGSKDKTFVISACDLSQKYTQQGVKLLSSATKEKAAETGVSRTFYANVCLPHPGQGAVMLTEIMSNLDTPKFIHEFMDHII